MTQRNEIWQKKKLNRMLTEKQARLDSLMQSQNQKRTTRDNLKMTAEDTTKLIEMTAKRKIPEIDDAKTLILMAEKYRKYTKNKDFGYLARLIIRSLEEAENWIEDIQEYITEGMT